MSVPPPTHRDPHPQPAPGSLAPSVVLVAALSLLAVGPPLHQALTELRSEGDVRALDLFRRVPTAESLKEYEGGLADRSVLATRVRTRYAALLDRTMQRGSAKVIIGRAGWLFQRESADFVWSGDYAGRRLPEGGVAPLLAILHTHWQLQQRGIQLLVVPVPVKETLMPERLKARADPDGLPRNPGVARLHAALAEHGVATLDPTPILAALKRDGHVPFMPRDTHWTPAGMRAVAAAIAARVGPRLADLPCHPFDTRRVDFHGEGDIARMLGYHPAPPMMLKLEQVAGDPSGRGPISKGGSPLLLLGDSFTNVFGNGEPDMGKNAGLAETLAREIGHPVDALAMPAGGATRARQALALRPELLEGKRVVVWEFTERDLGLAADGWKLVDLPRAKGAGAAAARPPVWRVRAEIVAIGTYPRNMGYPNCLVVLRYRPVHGSGEADFFVAHVGWKDLKPQPALAYEVGAVQDLVLVPIAGRVKLEEQCWLESVGMTEEPWWARSVVAR